MLSLARWERNCNVWDMKKISYIWFIKRFTHWENKETWDFLDIIAIGMLNTIAESQSFEERGGWGDWIWRIKGGPMSNKNNSHEPLARGTVNPLLCWHQDIGGRGFMVLSCGESFRIWFINGPSTKRRGWLIHNLHLNFSPSPVIRKELYRGCTKLEWIRKRIV